MASGNHIPCGPCGFDDVIKDAGRWCTRCEEGLCDDCEKAHRKSKSSRNHQVITIEDYRKIEHVSISQVCEQHGETLEWLCKSHDEVLCVVCVPSKHKACSDVIPISIYSANSRQSAALSDLEETINGTLRNVNQCIKNRESASNELEKQELEIKNMVHETRTKINGHLDKQQEQVLQELRSTSHTCKSKYTNIHKKLKSTEEMLTKLREQTIHMKQFSSDIQVFLGTRQVNKWIVHEVESIMREIGATKDFELKVSIHSLIEKLANDVEEFGKIRGSESTSNLDFRDRKFDQAQIGINVSTARNISNIKLKLIKSFQMTGTNKFDITGCVILPNSNLLIANNTEENKLIEYSETGEHIRDIQVSSAPCDIAVIDIDRIAVTYGDALFVEIINNNTFDVEKKISLQMSCLGVSYEDGKLYVVVGKDIQVMDLSGRYLQTLKRLSEDTFYIQASSNQIFYSDDNTCMVHCCNLNADELWQFRSDSIKYPTGVSVDQYKNVFVAGFISNNLTIIQHDGKECRTLLTKTNGLNCPQALHIDKDKSALLICNEKGLVALYEVV